ncbi:MAG TPA: hypothetical protein VN089_03415, partial [Duganella sp.]|nr:hypothetical protein [Duganella sp.]
NATVNVINVGTATPAKIGAGGRTEAKPPEETKKGGTAPDKELAARDGGADGAKTSAVAKKMYCN